MHLYLYNLLKQYWICYFWWFLVQPPIMSHAVQNVQWERWAKEHGELVSDMLPEASLNKVSQHRTGKSSQCHHTVEKKSSLSLSLSLSMCVCVCVPAYTVRMLECKRQKKRKLGERERETVSTQNGKVWKNSKWDVNSSTPDPWKPTPAHFRI